MFRLFAAVFTVFVATITAQAKPVELLNATLVAKLHFDEVPHKGQMVGAYQVSFRNVSGVPITQLNLLLNPGLSFQKVIGPNGKHLRFTSSVSAVSESESLQMSHAVINLAEPLNANSRTEIIIHYKGFLQDLSVGGLQGVKETLHPDFTMIRAKGGAYPLFSSPTIESLQKSWENKPFLQVAFIDMPGDNAVVGNLKVAEKSLKGNLTSYVLKNDNPTGMITLAIGPYDVEQIGMIRTAKLSEESESKERIIERASIMTNDIIQALGEAPGARDFLILDLPQGFQANDSMGLTIRNALDDGVEPKAEIASLFRQLAALWQTNSSPTHWSNSLLAVLSDVIWQKYADTWLGNSNISSDNRSGDIASFQALTQNSRAVGKTPLVDFAIDGLGTHEPAGLTISFFVVKELIGADAFFALSRGIRASLGRSYTDVEVIGEYMQANLTDKRARKFVKNWFFKGTIGKDLRKANTLADLVALYE